MTLRGRVHKYGANVDTDVIIPARHLNLNTAEELAPHCMEDIDAEFAQRVRQGDVIVADTNFGCGSSREHISSAEFYKYRDASGVLRYTDDISQIPEDQRPKIDTYTETDDYLTPEEKQHLLQLDLLMDGVILGLL